MLRTIVVAALLAGLIANPVALFSQCLIPPPLEDCNGTEPALSDNETITVGIKKWYYGSPATFNSITLRGGTLIVCGDLTFTNFSMDSGTIVIRPGARLCIGGGSGIVLRGHSYIYNHGTFECTSNLSLDPTWATPSKPNIVINATTSAYFKMSNQYFTINNANSFFVNRGRAEFWGLITDYGAGMNSVCLGRHSEMRMAVLYNNRRHTYTAPEGAACVSVFQYSQFRDTLTRSMNINICLGAGHVSDASCVLHGCRPNAWGTPNIFQFCNQCAGLQLLEKPQQPSVPTREDQEANIIVSPNPFAGLLSIKWKNKAPKEVQVYDLAGVVLIGKKIPASNMHVYQLQLPATIPAGKYFLKLIYENQVEVRQVVKID
jgi:hypothetical protein